MQKLQMVFKYTFFSYKSVYDFLMPNMIFLSNVGGGGKSVMYNF